MRIKAADDMKLQSIHDTRSRSKSRGTGIMVKNNKVTSMLINIHAYSWVPKHQLYMYKVG